jgi:DNA polymerase
MLHFIDFEVLSHNWLCVIKNPITKTRTVIVDDPKKLEAYYEEFKNEIFPGYNIRGYDQWIIKAILGGFNPKKMNDHIIVKKKSPYRFSSTLNKIPLNFFDIMPNPPVSLKTLEAFMGGSIKETTIPFDYPDPLDEEQIQEMIDYCEADVDASIDVFIRRKQEFDSQMSLIKTFKLPLEYIGKTKAQISATILGCKRTNYDDEWNISIIDTLDLKKYKYVMDWYLNPKNKDYSKKLETDIAGVPHTFGWGGLHGAIEKYHGTGQILHVDVASFYPAIMIEYGLLSRTVKNPEDYRKIRDQRLIYKAEKNPLQEPYKIVLNGTFGICKDKYSAAFDPRRANEICINGQLLLLDLIEHLEVIDGFQLIQSNTDGLIIKIPETQEAFDQVDDISFEWETRCRMGLGFDYLTEIYQKDVNNYLFIDRDGEIERKGAYVKENDELDNDLPIINTALVNYMVHNIPIESTVNECNDIIQFQKVVKLSSLYLYVKHNEERKVDKVFRVFASMDKDDSRILKVKEKIRKKTGEHYIGEEKFANTPDHCFIMNGDLHEANIPRKLDKSWYIETAKKRLEDYGVII